MPVDLTFSNISTVHAIITIILGVLTVIISFVALRYRRKEHRLRVGGIVEEARNTTLFLTRESMVKFLLSMYDKASANDTIWGQSIGGGSYTPEVHSKVLEAAAKGVKFKFILNAFSPTIEELQALFTPLRNAETVQGKDNMLRIQGLSEHEVVLAFPGIATYTGVLIKDRHFTRILKIWFDNRFEELKHKSEE